MITEATTSNVWILKNNTLITTPLSSNILPGVTRKKLIELANILNVKVSEHKFKESDVYKENLLLKHKENIKDNWFL